MNLIAPNIEEYAEQISTPELEILKQLSRETHLKVMNPIMLSGHLQGLFLKLIVAMLKPQNVLEIGTYTGYSAICIASALGENAKLTTIEINPELEDICRKYFSQSGFENKIDFIIGDALQIVPTLTQQYDLIYIDCDKHIYIDIYNLALEKLRNKGFILADNVLWHGKIFHEKDRNYKDADAIKKFNEFVKNDKRVTKMLLPFRDGIMIIQKNELSE